MLHFKKRSNLRRPYKHGFLAPVAKVTAPESEADHLAVLIWTRLILGRCHDAVFSDSAQIPPATIFSMCLSVCPSHEGKWLIRPSHHVTVIWETGFLFVTLYTSTFRDAQCLYNKKFNCIPSYFSIHFARA